MAMWHYFPVAFMRVLGVNSWGRNLVARLSSFGGAWKEYEYGQV
jgi:hypothetical protein